MKTKIIRAIFILHIITLFLACTENPFSNSKIKEDASSTISGVVKLEGMDEHSRIFVYLEKMDIYTWTDSTGHFKLTIPKKSEAPSGQGITDKLKLYFYVNNYKLDHAQIFMFDSAFKFGEEDLDVDGVLTKEIFLKKIVDLNVYTLEEIVLENGKLGGLIQFGFGFTNLTNDTYLLATHVDKFLVLFDFFIISMNGDNKVYPIKHSEGTKNLFTLTGQRKFEIDVRPVELAHVPSGRYRFQFYGYVVQDVPQALLNAIDMNVLDFGEEFIKLPMKINGTPINIINNL